MRLLVESLEQADAAPDDDSALLRARVRDAIEPLRAATAGLSCEGSLAVSGRAGLVSGRRFGGDGTLSVGVVHVLQADSVTQGQKATSPEVISGGGHPTIRVNATGVGYPVVGRIDATLPALTGSLTGEVGEPVDLTADDVPWLLREILFRLDDVANPPTPV